MYDFSLMEVSYTKEDLLRMYGEEELYRRYWLQFKVGTCKSPLHRDRNPSLSIFKRGQHIYWKDHTMNKGGGVFSFIMERCKQMGFSGTWKELYRKIHQDMGGNTALSYDAIEKLAKKSFIHKEMPSSEVLIQVVETQEGGIPDVFMPLWERYGITKSYLDAYHIGFAHQVWIQKQVDGELKHYLWGESTIDNPIFYYHFPESGHIKVYRPLEKNKRFKWIGNVTNRIWTDIQGYTQCAIEKRKPILLVLTKSMKDVVWLRLLGIDAIALHGERHNVDPLFIAHLRAHCRHLISVYDNDMPGMRGALQLYKDHDIKPYIIPKACGAKDITDLYLKDRYQLFHQIQILKERLIYDKDRYPYIAAAAA